MALDLTNVFANINNIKRSLFYPEGTTMKLVRMNQILLELTDDWYMQKDATSSLGDKANLGEEFFEATISDVDDTVDIDKIISIAEWVEINGDKYKISKYFRPRGVTKKILLRLTTFNKK